MDPGAKFIDDGVAFSPPAYVQRYGAVCDLIKDDIRWSGKIEKVVDFGCAELSLFMYLKGIASITQVLEVDYDENLLERFHSRAEPLFHDHLFQRKTPLSVSVLKGSVCDPDYRLVGCDAVIAVELIEHLDVGAFDRLPHNIFGFIQPKVAIITTPNADFNVLFAKLKDGGFRHYDHRFEWTREQFNDWANNIVTRYPNYSVEISGVAPGPKGTEHLGYCSQMAIFINNNYTKRPNLSPGDVQVDYSEVSGDILQTSNPLEMRGAGEKCNETTEDISQSSKDQDPSNSDATVKADCQPEVEISPPTTPTSESAVDENDNQSVLEYRDFVGAEMVPQLKEINPSDGLPLLWDCRAWENNTTGQYYKTIAEYEYPISMDTRSRQQKLRDHVAYKLMSYCNYHNKYYDEEANVWRLPLAYVLSLCHEFEDLSMDELRGILETADYEIDEECIVYKEKEESEEESIEENHVDRVVDGEQWPAENLETWDTDCPVHSDLSAWDTAEETWTVENASTKQPQSTIDGYIECEGEGNGRIETNAIFEQSICQPDDEMFENVSVVTMLPSNSRDDTKNVETQTNATIYIEKYVVRDDKCKVSGKVSQEETVEIIQGVDEAVDPQNCAVSETDMSVTTYNTKSNDFEFYFDSSMSGAMSGVNLSENLNKIKSSEKQNINETSLITDICDYVESNKLLISCDKFKSNSDPIGRNLASNYSETEPANKSVLLVEATSSHEDCQDIPSRSDVSCNKYISFYAESGQITLRSETSFMESNFTPEKTSETANFSICDVNLEQSSFTSSSLEDPVHFAALVGVQLNQMLNEKPEEDTVTTLCCDERSPSSPLAQFCNGSNDKDGIDMLSDSGYLKSQDSPQSPNYSDSFSNDLITPDKDVGEMVQSTILECIPENLNYITPTSNTKCNGKGSSLSVRRKSIGPITTLEHNKEFSECSSTIARPKSLNVCTTDGNVDGDFKTDQSVRMVCESPSLETRLFEINNRPMHRHFNAQNYEADAPQEQNRPNFLDLQNLQVAVLDHQNNNVDFEGNNIDEDEGARGNMEQDEDLEAVNLLRHRMDVHNENHLGEGEVRQDGAALEEELRQPQYDQEQGEEIVQEYRENCLGENYGCNPKSPDGSLLSAVSPSAVSFPLPTITIQQATEDDDANVLIDSIEKTLSLQSSDKLFMEEFPCCSKTCYNITSVRDDYVLDANMPSTSKKYTTSTINNFGLERKKTGHCLTTLLYSADHCDDHVYDMESEESLNDPENQGSLVNLFHSKTNLFELNRKKSSQCNIVESRDTETGLEGCLTIIGSHLNKCFSSSSFLDWNNMEIKLSDEESTIDIDVHRDKEDYSSEENIFETIEEPPVAFVNNKIDTKASPEVDSVHSGITAQESTELSSEVTSGLSHYYSIEDQSVLPTWFVFIMNNIEQRIDEDGANNTDIVFGPVEHQAGGDGVGIHTYPSTHSSGHSSMSQINQTVAAQMDRQAFSFTDIPYYIPPLLEQAYETSSSSNSSIDLQLPMEVVQDSSIVDTCHCEYCQSNNSDSASHHNYNCLNAHQDETLTVRVNFGNVIQDNVQDSSDDTYQSHSYRNVSNTNVNCSSPANNYVDSDCYPDSQYKDHPDSVINFPDDQTYRNVDSCNEFEDARSLGSCELFTSVSYNVYLRGIPSDMSGNYADIETDLDSEAD